MNKRKIVLFLWRFSGNLGFLLGLDVFANPFPNLQFFPIFGLPLVNVWGTILGGWFLIHRFVLNEKILRSLKEPINDWNPKVEAEKWRLKEDG